MQGLLRLIPLKRGRHSARLFVVAVALAALLPALTLAGYLAVESARAQRAQMELAAKRQTQEALAVIERELLATRNVLLALSTSRRLQRDDVAAFYDNAKEVSQKVGLQIVLLGRDSGQLINTAFPWGEPLTVTLPAPIAQPYADVLRSGKPVASGVFYGRLIKEYIVAVLVPVFRGDDLIYVLGAGIPAKRFAEILENLNIRAGESVSVIDQNGMFVARSMNHSEYVGKSAIYPSPGSGEGVIEGTGRNGIPSHWFTSRSDLLGWTVSTGVADRMLDAPLRGALTSLVIAGGSLSLVAIGLANLWGGRIARSAGALGIDRKPTDEEFEVLFDSAPNGVTVIDDQGRIALVNAQMEAQFGYLAVELIGQPVEVLVPERFRNAHLGLRQSFAAEPHARSMGADRDLYARRKDGTEFPVEIGLNPINSRAGKLVMISVIDISARKLARQRLDVATAERDELRRRFVNAQEQERLRLAHDLHDQTGQVLAAAIMEIKSVGQSVAEAERSRLRLLRLQLEQVGRTLHQVAWELRPASIDELGLQSALGNYVAEWSEQYGIESDFHCGDLGVEALPAEVCTTIYRVAQEALTNVFKHARHANSVSITLERVHNELRLTIEDDGCGFDVGAVQSRSSRDSGLGLAGIRERLTLIGADLQIESSIGGGTTLFARIPLQPRRTAA